MEKVCKLAYFVNREPKNILAVLHALGEEYLKDNEEYRKANKIRDLYLEYFKGHFYLLRSISSVDQVICCIDHLEYRLPTGGWEMVPFEKQRSIGWIEK